MHVSPTKTPKAIPSLLMLTFLEIIWMILQPNQPNLEVISLKLHLCMGHFPINMVSGLPVQLPKKQCHRPCEFASHHPFFCSVNPHTSSTLYGVFSNSCVEKTSAKHKSLSCSPVSWNSRRRISFRVGPQALKHTGPPPLLEKFESNVWQSLGFLL